MGENIDIVIVLGTRPEIIKLAPIIDLLENADISFSLVHTNQHYDVELSGTFFEQLELPPPDVNCHIGSGSQGEQTAEGIVQIENQLKQSQPEVAVAQGDTNAVLATAIAVSKTDTDFAHVEAGIRSFDRSMPEEVNRVLADRVTDLAFAPTEEAVMNLENEGVAESAIYQFGNTIVDACLRHRNLAASESNILSELALASEEYGVVTIHRPRNTDTENRLATILAELGSLDIPLVFPAHPRAEEAVQELNSPIAENIRVLPPLDYLDFLWLQDNARIIITDSGGVQEEASILQVPCVTVRPNTERPETVRAGVNTLVEPGEIGMTVRGILHDDRVHQSMTGQPDLYGSPGVSQQIVDILLGELRSDP
jgi:UDP-N-acetylglucosamine 2-epimerase